ncbi:MAG: hypothetical protein ACLP8S_03325, partial [Solirubrobacteraceae bacterium]
MSRFERDWDPRTERASQTLAGPPVPAVGAALSPDGGTLYVATSGGAMLEWDLRGDRRLRRHARLGQAVPCCTTVQPQAPPAALSPDGTRIALRTGPSRVG